MPKQHSFTDAESQHSLAIKNERGLSRVTSKSGVRVMAYPRLENLKHNELTHNCIYMKFTRSFTQKRKRSRFRYFNPLFYERLFPDLAVILAA